MEWLSKLSAAQVGMVYTKFEEMCGNLHNIHDGDQALGYRQQCLTLFRSKMYPVGSIPFSLHEILFCKQRKCTTNRSPLPLVLKLRFLPTFFHRIYQLCLKLLMWLPYQQVMFVRKSYYALSLTHAVFVSFGKRANKNGRRDPTVSEQFSGCSV